MRSMGGECEENGWREVLRMLYSCPLCLVSCSGQHRDKVAQHHSLSRQREQVSAIEGQDKTNTPRHATPRHATPRRATPRHVMTRYATPRHAMPLTGELWASLSKSTSEDRVRKPIIMHVAKSLRASLPSIC